MANKAAECLNKVIPISQLVLRSFKSPGFILFLLFSFALYGSLVPLLSWVTFSDDDAHIMRIAAEYGWLDVYFKPEVYQQLSVAHYTPVELTIYKLLLSIGGLNPAYFLVSQLMCFAVISAMAAQLCLLVTKGPVKSFLVILFIFSNGAILTLASRFYTTHYLVGAVFALFSFIVLVSPLARSSLLFSSLSGVAVLMSLLAKEVYVVSAFLIGAFAIKQRNWSIFLSAAIAVVIYLGMRFHVIGYSSEGRSGNGYLSEMLSLDISQWLGFASWYAESKLLILLLALSAFIINARKFIPSLLVALLFAVPSLAAPHSIISPELHADRVFFAFDCALVFAAMFAIASKPSLVTSIKNNLKPPLVVSASLTLILSLMFFQFSQAKLVQEVVTNTSDYKVTTRILASLKSASEPLTVYAPLSYQSGELMSVVRLLGQKQLHITQNCRLVTRVFTTGRVVVFDERGNNISLNALQDRCEIVDLTPDIIHPVSFTAGRLEWRFNVKDDYVAGVLFVDRALAVPLREFSERLVRPKPKERYQLFAYRGNQWWFSDIRPVLMN